MCKSMQRLACAGLLLIVAMPAMQSQAANDSPASTLLLTPARCVALHQGQICYQQVQVSWSSSDADDYCLYQQHEVQPLQCWKAQTQGVYEFEFASDGSRVLQLKNASQHVVAESTLEVAWVYKSNTRRKTHWRLF